MGPIMAAIPIQCSSADIPPAAQLAALLCTDESLLKAEGLSLSIIKGCVPVDGDTYDVPLQIASVENRVADRYRWKFGDEQSQKDLSPVTHITRGKNIPPFLILYVADSSDTRPQSQRLFKSLEEAGISAKISAPRIRNTTSSTTAWACPTTNRRRPCSSLPIES